MSEYKLNKYLAKLENTSNSLKRELYNQKVSYYRQKNMKGGNLPELRNSLKQNYKSIFNGLDELSHITKQTINMSKNYNNVVRAVMFGNHILTNIRDQLGGPVRQSIHNKDQQIKASQPGQKGGNYAEVERDINELWDSLVKNQEEINATKQQIDGLIAEIIELINALELCRKALLDCTKKGRDPRDPINIDKPAVGPDGKPVADDEDRTGEPGSRHPTARSSHESQKRPGSVNELGDDNADGVRGPGGVAVPEEDERKTIPHPPPGPGKCDPVTVTKLVLRLITVMGKRDIVGKKLNECETKYANLMLLVRGNLDQIKALASRNAQGSEIIKTSLTSLTSALAQLRESTNNYAIADCNGNVVRGTDPVSDDQFASSVKAAKNSMEELRKNSDWPADIAQTETRFTVSMPSYTEGSYENLVDKISRDRDIMGVEGINDVLNDLRSNREHQESYKNAMAAAKQKYDSLYRNNPLMKDASSVNN